MRPILAAAALALCIVLPARAGDFYAGAAIGGELDGRFDNAPGKLDVDNTKRVYFGWNFSGPWSVEASYHDFGDASCCGIQITDFAFDAETDGVSLGLAYSPTFGRWSPLTALGFFHANTDEDVVSIAGRRNVSSSESGVMAEVGARFAVNDLFGLRASYQWFDFENGSDGSVTIGAEVSF